MNELKLTRTVTPGELAKLANVCNSTATAWIKHGVSIGGNRVKLHAMRLGWKWQITPEAWERFKADCNPDFEPLPESQADATRRLEAGKKAALKMLGRG